MSGGGCSSGNNALSFLQTPSYQVVAVFAIFVLITLAVEYLIKRIAAHLDRNGTKGMRRILQELLLEFVMLGLISFLLETLGEYIGKICVGKERRGERLHTQHYDCNVHTIHELLGLYACVCVCACFPKEVLFLQKSLDAYIHVVPINMTCLWM